MTRILVDAIAIIEIIVFTYMAIKCEIQYQKNKKGDDQK
jgi:hypothetical protein